MSEELFKGKYRNDTFRHKNWDYANSASYFVTISTSGRKPYLSKIINGKVILSEIGLIVEREWKNTGDLRPEMNLIIHDFIIMPDHIHGIISIGNNQFNTESPRRDASHASYNESGDSLDESHSRHHMYKKFGPQKSNLSAIIRGFKGTVTSHARKIEPNFKWQKLYHDRIIRDRLQYDFIKNYIKDNPKNWVS